MGEPGEGAPTRNRSAGFFAGRRRGRAPRSRGSGLRLLRGAVRFADEADRRGQAFDGGLQILLRVDRQVHRLRGEDDQPDPRRGRLARRRSSAPRARPTPAPASAPAPAPRPTPAPAGAARQAVVNTIAILTRPFILWLPWATAAGLPRARAAYREILRHDASARTVTANIVASGFLSAPTIPDTNEVRCTYSSHVRHDVAPRPRRAING